MQKGKENMQDISITSFLPRIPDEYTEPAPQETVEQRTAKSKAAWLAIVGLKQ